MHGNMARNGRGRNGRLPQVPWSKVTASTFQAVERGLTDKAAGFAARHHVARVDRRRPASTSPRNTGGRRRPASASPRCARRRRTPRGPPDGRCAPPSARYASSRCPPRAGLLRACCILRPFRRPDTRPGSRAGRGRAAPPWSSDTKACGADLRIPRTSPAPRDRWQACLRGPRRGPFSAAPSATRTAAGSPSRS